MNKTLKYSFIWIFFILMGVYGVNAINYNNVSFTNQQFYNGAILSSKIIQINNTHIGIGYINSTSAAWYNICLLNGTNCGTPVNIQAATYNSNGIDIFLDTTNNKIIHIAGRTGTGQYFITNLDGSNKSGGTTFNAAASTDFVSAVQINSTDFAIAYQDTGDTNDASIIICKLDGTSCGTEIDVNTGTTSYNKIKLLNSTHIGYIMYDSTNAIYYTRTIIGGASTGPVTINSGATAYLDLINGSDNKLKIVFRDDADTNKGKFITCNLNGTSCSSEVQFSATGYYNKILEFNNKLLINYRNSPSTGGKLIFMNLTGGELSNESTFNSNQSDYISNIINTNNILLISYGDSTSNKGMIAISESLITFSTVTINAPTATYYNSTNITLNVTTNLNTNLSYSLNGGATISLGTNINSSYSNITGIVGLNNLTVFSNYSNAITNSSVSFTIDTTPPTISNNILSEYNSYTNNNLNSSCTDTNLNYCNISMNGQNKNLSLLFNFTTNGNQTYNITAVDLAGNTITTTGVTLVNPYQRFYFSNGSTLLTNFTFGGTSFSGTEANFTTYNSVLSQGNNSLSFIKSGYLTQIFTIPINTTSNYNTTYNISKAYINVNIKNKNDGNLITGTNFTLDFIASVGLSTSTTTGIVSVNNIFFRNESYIITASGTGYAPESARFDFDNQQNLTVNMYMINTSSSSYGIVYVQLNDISGLGITGAYVYALQWDTNSSNYVQVSSGQTAEDGKSPLNIILDTKYYIFMACYQGQCYNSTSQIIPTTQNGKTITLSTRSATTTYKYQFEDFYFQATESYNNNSGQSNITYYYNNLDGYSRTACIYVYHRIGNNEVYQSNLTECSTGVSATILRTYTINSSLPTTIKVGFIYNNGFIPLKVFPHTAVTGSFQDTFTKMGLIMVILPLLFVVSVGLGLLSKNIYIGLILIIVSAGVSLYLLPITIINMSVVAFIAFMAIVTMWGAS